MISWGPLLFGAVTYGLAAGAVIALLGAGIVATQRGSSTVNLAHGAVAMFATYVYALLMGGSPLSNHPLIQVGVAAVAGVAAGALIGLLIDRMALRRLATRAPAARMAATVGILYLLMSLAQLLFGPSTRMVPSIFGNGTQHLGTLTVGNGTLGTIAVAVVLAPALGWFYQRSRLGTSIRAVADSPDTAAELGLRVARLRAFSWMLGGSLAALAGILVAPSLGLNSFLLTLLVIQALAAALTGRLQHLLPTVAAGLAIGIATALARSILDATTAANPPAWINLTNIGDLVALVWSLVAIHLWRRDEATPRLGRSEPLLQVADRRLRPVFIVVLALVCLVVPSHLSAGNLYTLTIGAAEAVGILSLVLLTGMAGQFSLAQGGLMGIGAFAAGRLALMLHGDPFPLMVVIGGLAAAVVGAAVGAATLRVSGTLMAVLTLTVSEAISGLLLTAPMNGGGFGGLTVPRAGWLGDGVHYCWFALACLAVLIAFVCSVRIRGTGRRLAALKDMEHAAPGLGISVVRERVVVYAVSGFIAGVAGVLYAGTTQLASASDFGPFLSVALIAGAIIGGLGSTAGAVIGGLLLSAGPALVGVLPGLAALPDPGDAAGAVLGLLMVLQVSYFPEGISHPLLGMEARVALWTRRHLALRPLRTA